MSILSISSSNSKNYTEVQKNVVEDNFPIIQLPSKVECDRSVCTPYQHCVQKQGAKKYDDTNKVMGRRKSEEIIAMNCLATEHDNVQLNSLSTNVTICDSETHDSVREQVKDVNKHKNKENLKQDLICTECGKKYRHYSSLYKHKQQVHSIISSGKIACREPDCLFSCSFISKLHDHLKQAHGKVIEEEEATFSSNQGMQQICFIYNIWVCSVIIIQCNFTPYLKYKMFFVNWQLLICSI